MSRSRELHAEVSAWVGDGIEIRVEIEGLYHPGVSWRESPVPSDPDIDWQIVRLSLDDKVLSAEQAGWLIDALTNDMDFEATVLEALNEPESI
jgi:hypothetical protein